jgi:hypothetical protein
MKRSACQEGSSHINCLVKEQSSAFAAWSSLWENREECAILESIASRLWLFWLGPHFTQGGKQLCSFPHSHLLITLDPDLFETAGPTAPSVVDQSSRGTSSAPFP